MTKLQRNVLVGSVVLSVLLIAGALLFKANTGQVEPPRTVSVAELERSDGKDGRTCLVAVDGTVYKIQGFSLWQNGEHKSSEGKAYCGADMSEEIDESPHGRRMLDLLITVGPLGR